jgi:hypothetical protein
MHKMICSELFPAPHSITANPSKGGDAKLRAYSGNARVAEPPYAVQSKHLG